MTTFEKICSESWRPYGANYKKIFDSLKKENFRPYDCNIKEVKIHNFSRKGSPEVDGIYLTTMIEELFVKKSSSIFSNMYSDYFLDLEYYRLSQSNDNEGLEKYKNEQENKRFLVTHYFSSDKKRNMGSRQWYNFIDSFIKEFNIDINQIRFFSITYDGCKIKEFNKKEELKKKTYNILSKAVSSNASLPEIESLIKLGANPMYICDSDFTSKKENFFLEFIGDENKTIVNKCAFLKSMLNLHPELIHLSIDDAFECNNSIFNILNTLPEEHKEILHHIIYERFENSLKDVLLTPVCDKTGFSIKENNLEDYFFNNSPQVKARIEKKALSSLLKKEMPVAMKKRL